jgi:hypothetical protein
MSGRWAAGPAPFTPVQYVPFTSFTASWCLGISRLIGKSSCFGLGVVFPMIFVGLGEDLLLVGESSGPPHLSIAFMELNLLLYHSESS